MTLYQVPSLHEVGSTSDFEYRIKMIRTKNKFFVLSSTEVTCGPPKKLALRST